MKNQLNLLLFSLILNSLNPQLNAENKIIEGNLSVLENTNEGGGNIDVIGETRLSHGGLPFPTLHDPDLSATYRGPIEMFGDSTGYEIDITKTGNNETGDFEIPLGVCRRPGTISVKAVIHGYNDNMAYWDISTNRHESPLPVVEHKAFGAGTEFTLSGFSSHGNVFLKLRYNHVDRNPGRELTVRYTIHISGSGVIEPDNRHPNRPINDPRFIDVKILDSIKWGINPQFAPIYYSRSRPASQKVIDTDRTQINGDLTVSGKMLLAEPQGDISMGIFGNQP